MICSVCASSNVKVIRVEYPFLTHLDYSTIKTSGEIGRCRNCQSLLHSIEDGAIAKVEQLLGGIDYARSKQTSQTFRVNEFSGPVTRSFLQAELISRRLMSEKPSVLDIGAFDGQLLLELDARFPKAQLHGFDVNPHLRASFPSKDNFRFWSSDLASIYGKFDLISMSHSIMYEKSVERLMRHIKRLLKPDGFLFVQVPDITASPCYLLFGDQHYFYTANIMKNALELFGFAFASVESNWFPREIVCTAKPTTQGRRPFIEDTQVYNCIRDLDEKAVGLKDLPCGSKVGVLGTTANAAFVDSLLGDHVTRFFDENPKRVGGKFRNKEILHPHALTESDVLVIPYGESGQGIQKRFTREYAGKFYVV